jgi:hypothetical protein
LRFSTSHASKNFDQRPLSPYANTLSVNAVDFFIFLLGLLLNIAGYGNFLVFPMGLFYFIVGYVLIIFFGLNQSWECRVYVRMFAIGWLAMGISAFYDFVLESKDLDGMDSAAFFEAAKGLYRNLTITDLLVTHEGGLAIKIWQEIYDSFALFGIPKERFIGILVNVLAVSFSGVIAMRSAKHIYGNDSYRSCLLFYMITLCGMNWLFAGFHLRDSFVLLAVTSLLAVWIWFLRWPAFGFRLLIVTIFSLGMAGILQSLRGEFLFLPLAFGLAACPAILFSHKSSIKNVWRWLFLILVIPIIVGTAVFVYSEVRFLMEYTSQLYLAGSGGIEGSSNPGWVLVYQSPWYVQVFLRPLVMFVFPLPVWSGLQLDSAYVFFKGLATPLFYVILPLAGIAAYYLYRFPVLRSPQQLFLFFISLGMTLAIAFTSGETRHLGVFLIPIFLFCLLPNIKEQTVRYQYWKLLSAFFIFMTLAHGFWLLRRF